MRIVSERSKESKEQKKNKESVLVAESAYKCTKCTVWPRNETNSMNILIIQKAYILQKWFK